MFEFDEAQVAELARIAGISDVSTLVKKEDGSAKEPTEIFKRLTGAFQNRFTTIEQSKETELSGVKAERFDTGWKESRKALEKKFKELGLDGFRTVDDAIDLIRQKLETQPTGDVSKLNEEELRKLPQFMQLVGKVKDTELAQIQQERDNAVQELETIRKDQLTSTKRTAVTAYLQKYLADKKTAGWGAYTQGSSDAINAYINAMGGLDAFDVKADGDQVTAILPMVNKGGKMVQATDQYHIPLSINDYVDKSWIFGFGVAPNEPTPGAKPNSNGGGNSGEFNFTTKDGFEAALRNAGEDRQKIAAIRLHWSNVLAGK